MNKLTNACGRQTQNGCDKAFADLEEDECRVERRCEGCALSPSPSFIDCELEGGEPICPTCEHFKKFLPSNTRKSDGRVIHWVFCVGLTSYVPHGTRSEKVTHWDIRPACMVWREGGFKTYECRDYKRRKAVKR